MAPVRQGLLHRFNQRSAPVIGGTGATLLAATVILTFVQVVLRYVFSSPLSWIEEVARYCFLWITFTGMALAYRHQTHIRIDLFSLGAPSRARTFLARLRNALEITAVLIVLVTGILLVISRGTTRFFSIPSLPLFIAYIALPLGAGFALFYLVEVIRNGPDPEQH